MMMKEKMMTQQELQMFGMSTDRIEKEYMNSLTAKLSGQEMVVMSILSDCQELIGDGGAGGLSPRMDEVRKQLNVAKYILSEMMDQKRAA